MNESGLGSRNFWSSLAAVIVMMRFFNTFTAFILTPYQIVLTVFSLFAFLIMLYQSVSFVMIQSSDLLKSFHRTPWAWIVFGLVLGSVMWSDTPNRITSAVILTVLSILYALFWARRFKISEQVQLIAWACSIGAVLSIICVLTTPYGVMSSFAGEFTEDQADYWQGIYSHKNTLGINMALGALACTFSCLWGKKWRAINIIGTVLCLVCLYKSHSKTALVNLVAVSLTVMCVVKTRLFSKSAFYFLTFGFIGLMGLGVFFVITNLDAVTSALNRDITLTGRVVIWQLLEDAMMKHPWLGYGYASFWPEGLDGWKTARPEAKIILDVMGFHAPHSHNGYIETVLAIGLVGLTASLGLILGGLIKALQRIRNRSLSKENRIWTAWLLSLFLFSIFYNVTEVSMPAGLHPLWMLVQSAAFFLTLSRDRKPSDSIIISRAA